MVLVVVLDGILGGALSGGVFGGGDPEHLLDAGELHARATGGLAEGALVAVDR